MQRTVKIKVNCPKERTLETLRVASEVFSLHVETAFTEKTYNKLTLHRLCYAKAREQYPELQSSLVQTIRDTASEAVKASKFKRKPKKRKYSAIRFNSRAFSIRGNHVSFSLLGGRHKCEVFIPTYYRYTWENGQPSGATLNFDGKQFWLHIGFKLPDIKQLTKGNVVGIDRGICNIAVCSDGTFYSSNRIRAMQRRMLFNRRALQTKRHSRSAKRRLKSMRKREQRFQKDCNHVITKKIAASPATIFVLEDLSKIRVRSRRKGRNWNQRFNRWAFFQFEQFLRYKAEAAGKSVVLVDARGTSQNCSVCGSPGDRRLSHFACSRCGYKQHADLNAAFNIRNRYLSSLENSEAGGVVNPPNARSDEVKAMRKHRIEMELHEQAA